jgi:phosphoenolpyruvate-protein kinase (PTS system EI component)
VAGRAVHLRGPVGAGSEPLGDRGGLVPKQDPTRDSAGSPQDPGAAALRIEAALEQVAEELTSLADRLRSQGRTTEAEIVEVGALIAGDPMLLAETLEQAGQGWDPVEAVMAVAGRHAAAMEALSEPALRDRAADIRQVGRRAAAILAGEREEAGGGPEGPLVLIAEELGPADVLAMEAGRYAGAAAATGGANAHAAIVARALGLPLVLGLGREILGIGAGVPVALDGDGGLLTAEPREAELAAVRTAMDAGDRHRAALRAERSLPCRTMDGVSVRLMCNASTVAETRAGLEAGADGVGLLRTELPFLDATSWPGEEEHLAALRPILSLLEGREAVVRVLDFGGDKLPPFLTAVGDAPAGGSIPAVRGLPQLLSTPDALASQMRAALKAGRASHLKLLVPMITSLREIHVARAVLQAAARDVSVEPPPIGVMVEVPAAALLASRLVEEADFLSIGTNDLTQHALGVSRADPAALPSLAAHPSILALLNRVARAGSQAKCSVRVCGEAGADPLVVPLLIGMGIRALSVAPARVDEVRARIRRLSAETCAAAARDALRLESVEDVWDLVRERCLPELS